MKKLAFLLVFLAGCVSDPSKPDAVITEPDNNTELTLKKGSVLQIKLKSDGVPDCFWGCKKAPDNVEFLTEGKVENLFEFNFKVKSDGPLTLEYVLFTDKGVEKKKEFTVKLKTID